MSKKEYFSRKIDEEKWIVLVRERGTSVRKLENHTMQSLPGKDFLWGANLPESADLARSILLDTFGHTTCETEFCQCDSDWVDPYYGEFAEEYVQKFEEEWKVSQLDIADWVFDKRRLENE